MGEYLSPPFGMIQLAAYVEREFNQAEIEVLDCTAKKFDWEDIERRIKSFNPDIVCVSAFATCNVYPALKTIEIAKKVNPNIVTTTGGQYFTAAVHESLEKYPEIDVIVRGEGEQTLTELVKALTSKSQFSKIDGLSFRHDGKIFHNKDRALIGDLDSLPYPGYHFVRDTIQKYHFAAMGGRNAPYAMVEGARGCSHKCLFCTQWKHWGKVCRLKSSKRIVDEIEFCYKTYGSRFIWLTDDDFGPGDRAERFADELLTRQLGDDLMLFIQWRCDDVIKNKNVLSKLRKAGLYWVMMGVESPRPSTLKSYRKGIEARQAFESVRLLKENRIFSHAMFVIGNRKDTKESIRELRLFADELDPDFAVFTALTPFLGTEIYEEAKRNGWIEDHNLSHYDMAHAIMPTETLSRLEVQEELYGCYRSFYGSWRRRLGGLFSKNRLKSRLYRHMMGQGVLRQFKELIPFSS